MIFILGKSPILLHLTLEKFPTFWRGIIRKNLQGFCADSSLSFPVSISRNIMMPQLQYINQR